MKFWFMFFCNITKK